MRAARCLVGRGLRPRLPSKGLSSKGHGGDPVSGRLQVAAWCSLPRWVRDCGAGMISSGWAPEEVLGAVLLAQF